MQYDVVSEEGRHHRINKGIIISIPHNWMFSGKPNNLNSTTAFKNKVRESILEERGKQLHVALMIIVASYSVLFFFVNIFLDQTEQAFVSLAALPAVTVTYLLYHYGYYYYSKVWNSFQITVLISLIVLYSRRNGRENFLKRWGGLKNFIKS